MALKRPGMDRRTFARLLALGAPTAAWTAPLAAATRGGQAGRWSRRARTRSRNG